MYIDEFSAGFGVKPKEWEGAAYIMGNSLRQWWQSYAPTHKSRMASVAIAGHSRYAMARAVGGAAEAAVEMDEGMDGGEEGMACEPKSGMWPMTGIPHFE